MNKKKAYLTIVCFALIFTLGFEAGGFQISLLSIMENAGVAASLSGVLVSGQYGAIVIMPLLMGGLADRKGKRKFLAIFCFVFAAGCFAMSTLRPFAALFLSAFVIGTGYSVTESLATALLADAHGEKSSKYMNLSQCFFSFGAMISPQIMDYGRTHWGWSYQSHFSICVGMALAVAAMAIMAARGETVSVPAAEEKKTKIGKEILLLAAGMFIYCSLELSMSYYMDAFVSLELNSPEHAANILSLFWLFTIVGRLVCGSLYRYRKPMLKICYLVTGAVLILLMVFPSLSLAYVCFPIASAFMASIWPNLMSIAAERYPDNSAQATGIMSTGAGIGAAGMPLLLGALMDTAGLRPGFCFVGVLAILGVAVCLAYDKVTG